MRREEKGYGLDASALTAGASTVEWPAAENKIPRAAYEDPDLYAREMRAVFAGPVWNLVGHEAELPLPGDYKTSHVGDIPVIIIRRVDGSIGVLVNACAHRGAQILHKATGSLGAKRSLTCIYHYWTYDFEGRLKNATWDDNFPDGFCKDDYALPVGRVESYRGAIFTSFSTESAPLVDYLGDLKEKIDFCLGDGDLVFLGANKAVYQCNWKLFGENMYDGYHAFVLHKALHLMKAKSAGGITNVAEYQSFGHVCHEYRSLAPDGEIVFRDQSIIESRTKEDPLHMVMNVFPLGVVQNHQDTIALRYAIPRGVDRTELQFAYFGRKGESEEVLQHRMAQASNLWGPTGFVSVEDAAVLGRMQRGAAARGDNVVLKGAGKRFPPYRSVDEAAVTHFYGAYRRLMGL